VPSDVYNSVVGAAPVIDAAAAGKAFAEAREAVSAGDVSLAFQHACAAVTLDPNHADARRLLGYRRIGDVWAGGYAQKMLDDGNAWQPQFGWVKAEDVAKFEQGLRPYGGRWIPAADDARRHATIDRGWAVRTDHFLVVTDIDRAAGVQLAMRLETLYQLWRQLFGEFSATPAELAARLDGKESADSLRKPFKVIYHRSRAEYNGSCGSGSRRSRRRWGFISTRSGSRTSSRATIRTPARLTTKRYTSSSTSRRRNRRSI
jgi:hypothetical protein